MKPGKYTIQELFVNREVEQIVIPEIQRDYVWQKEQVEGLLKSLKDDFIKFQNEIVEVNSNNEEIKNLFIQFYRKQVYASNIGFIYAYNDEEYKGKYFLIDGQQRITTVYLLLLNLFILTNQKQEFKNKYFKDKQLKIDFKVRESSHDFFKNYIEFRLNSKAEDDFQANLKSQYWYYENYKDDKTIQSIIVNDSIIHEFIFHNGLNTNDFLKYILNFVDCWYFDTNISEQGEELYIYMNARGEQIQNNENIKADLLGALKEKDLINISERDDYNHEKNLNGLKKYWGKKWEDWQDFFWENKGSNENADIGFNEFLRWTQIICMSKNRDIDTNNENEASKDKKDIVEVIKWEKEGIKLDVEYLKLEDIDKYLQSLKLLFSEDNFSEVISEYNNYKIQLSQYFERNWLEGNSNGKQRRNFLSQIDCFRLLPILEFTARQLELNSIDFHNVFRFCRYIYNLSRKDNISKAANINCINGIILANNLKGNLDSMLKLSNVSKSLLTDEEITKFRLYFNPPSLVHRIDLEKSFWKAEDLKVLKGEISILFELINYNSSGVDKFSINEFRSVENVFVSVFEKEVSDLFRKALLSLDDYKVYESYTWTLGMNRYHLCNSVDEWNTLIKSSDKFKELVLRLQNQIDIETSMQNIVQDNSKNISDWRLKFLSSDLPTLGFSEEKRICVHENEVYLLKGVKVFNENFYKKI